MAAAVARAMIPAGREIDAVATVFVLAAVSPGVAVAEPRSPQVVESGA